MLAGKALAMLSRKRKESERANLRLWEVDYCPVQAMFLPCPSGRRFGPTMRNKSIPQAMQALSVASGWDASAHLALALLTLPGSREDTRDTEHPRQLQAAAFSLNVYSCDIRVS